MFSSLRWPLALAILLAIVLPLGLAEASLLGVVREAYLKSAQEGLQQECSFIANLMRRHMDQTLLSPTARKMITDEMARLSLHMSGRLSIVNWKGDILEDSAHRKGENVRHRPEVTEALHGHPAMVIRGHLEDSSDATMFVAVPMRAQGKVVGAIYGSRSLADLQLTLVALRERLYAVALASLVAGLLLSMLLARWLTAPLRRLTRAVQRFGAGYLEERIPVHSRDETGILGRSFNDMAASLKTQQEALLRFVSDASHELKTPLASLRSLLEALEAGAPQEQFMGLVHRDLDRMEKLVGDLLDLHRLENSALSISPQSIDLAQFLPPLAQEHGVEWESCTGRIQADPDRLRQVISNLLVNARRAAPQGRVSVGAAEGSIWVLDDGVGLEAEHLPRLFDRFYRVDGARSRQHGGTGLGLAISKALVEAMGGQVAAHSDGPGRGARFTLRFPDAS
jgi:signal transduction histidine kinase